MRRSRASPASRASTTCRAATRGSSSASASSRTNAALAALPVEAFPASIELDVAPDMPDAELADMVGKMRQLPAVDDVETYQSWTERLARLVRGGVAASALLAVVVLGAVLAVVGSTMRMALQRRRTEVEVLKLVGATDAFVKKPFVIEGSLQGAIGAAGAIALLAVLFFLVRGRLDGELASLVGVEPDVPALAGGARDDRRSAALLGAAAALASLRKMVAV